MGKTGSPLPGHKMPRTRRREERKGKLKAVVKGEREKALFSHKFSQIKTDKKLRKLGIEGITLGF